MERATKVEAVVFDKTGTLTIGKPTVLEHRVFDPQVGAALCLKTVTCCLRYLAAVIASKPSILQRHNSASKGLQRRRQHAWMLNSCLAGAAVP